MQTESPLARHLHGDSDRSSDLSDSWGNTGLTVLDAGNEYYLPVTASSRSSPGPQGSTAGHAGTVSSPASDSTSPFVINISWDASVSNAPAGFTTAVMKAVQFLESQFSNPVTINIDVGYGEVMGQALGGGVLGESLTYLSSVDYTSLTSALTSHATTAADQSAVATLPSLNTLLSTNPTLAAGNFWVSTSEAKALGLQSGSSVDGYVGFSSQYGFTYDDSNGVAGGTFDFYGTVLHEITEVMGRLALDGGSIGSVSNSYYPLDLYHYSSAGGRDLSFSTPGYLSTDGGVTDSGDLNTVSGGDPGDWASSMGNDSFDAFANSGVVNSFSADDLTTMSLLGWEPAGSSAPPPPPPPPSPTGVSFSLLTSTVRSSQTTNGLAANRRVASVTQTGGVSGDSFTYTLGGSGAGSFALTSANNAATLSTSASGAVGAANGKLYALTVTANDTTNGASSPASPLDIVVGSPGNDTIDLATLVGAGSTATPTFVYGLAGKDTIDGTAMTSKLSFVRGPGADVMTGGSGVNDYIYFPSVLPPGAHDVITNFNAATDLIDLTGLNTRLFYVGALPASTTDKVLPGRSIGYQTSGGNTFACVNTTWSPEAVGSANLGIELQGNIALTSSNFLHH